MDSREFIILQRDNSSLTSQENQKMTGLIIGFMLMVALFVALFMIFGRPK